MRVFRTSLGVGVGLNAPAFLIKMGTALLGVDSELVLRGMNVTSNQTERMQFHFAFPSLEEALDDLSKK
jgi:NAD dependent epimerase/dehydratase family enzyme